MELKARAQLVSAALVNWVWAWAASEYLEPLAPEAIWERQSEPPVQQVPPGLLVLEQKEQEPVVLANSAMTALALAVSGAPENWPPERELRVSAKWAWERPGQRPELELPVWAQQQLPSLSAARSSHHADQTRWQLRPEQKWFSDPDDGKSTPD